MSWLKDLGGENKRTEPFKDTGEGLKVPDPHIPGRLVADKPANRPFLAYVGLLPKIFI